ncbi:TPA: hypothetical protein ACS70H_000504 [Providencia alcalifaciens]
MTDRLDHLILLEIFIEMLVTFYWLGIFLESLKMITDNKIRGKFMPWKPIVAIFVFAIYLVIFFGVSVSALRDNTCGGTDEVSLEKRCQSAVNYNKARQVNL